MSYTPLTDSCGEVADFLSQHSRNFCFLTSIADSALTLSFQPTNITPISPPALFTISELPTPPYSPFQWDRSPVGREEPIVSPAPEAIPISAGSILNGTDAIDDTLPTVQEKNEVPDDEFNKTLNITFGECFNNINFTHSLINILAHAGYSIVNDSSTTTTNDMPETWSIEQGDEQVLSSLLMDSSKNLDITNDDTPSQAPVSVQDGVNITDPSINIFFVGSTINPDGLQVPIPPNLDDTPPIPPTPLILCSTLHDITDMPVLASPDSVYSFHAIDNSLLSVPHVALLEEIIPHDAGTYRHTKIAQLNDYHSFYFANIVNAISSYLFCQDQLISNDWDIELHRDDMYLGHPVLPGNPMLPTGGPCSIRDWSDRCHAWYATHTMTDT
jgi:hypothetical protein